MSYETCNFPFVENNYCITFSEWCVIELGKHQSIAAVVTTYNVCWVVLWSLCYKEASLCHNWAMTDHSLSKWSFCKSLTWAAKHRHKEQHSLYRYSTFCVQCNMSLSQGIWGVQRSICYSLMVIQYLTLVWCGKIIIYHAILVLLQEGQHPLTGQRAANFRRDLEAM